MTAPSQPNTYCRVTIDAGGVGYLDRLDVRTRGRRAKHLPDPLRTLPRPTRPVLRAVAAFARLVDQIGAGVDGDRARLLELLELDVRAAAAGTARVGVVRALAPALASGAVPVEPLLALIALQRAAADRPVPTRRG